MLQNILRLQNETKQMEVYHIELEDLLQTNNQIVGSFLKLNFVRSD